MLVDKEMFNLVENALREQGVIGKFEAENGEITGHMMITMMEIPSELSMDITDDNVKAFCASFDFFDMMIGIAVDLSTMKPILIFGLHHRLNVQQNHLLNG